MISGAILPLSGPTAQYGKWIKEGLELAKEQVNTDGGIGGVPLRIIYEDDQATPRLAASAMQKLAEVDKVPFVFGSWASSSVLAQAPIAEKNEVVVMAEAVSPKIRDAGEYTFRIQPDGQYYMQILAPFVFNKMKLRKIAIIYVNNDFGVDLAAKFKEIFIGLGGGIVSENGFKQGKTDLRTELSLALASNPDAIFAPTYTEIGYLLKQAKELGAKIPFIAAATFENPSILNIAQNTAEGVVYPHHFDALSINPKAQQYQVAYKAKYGRLSEGFAVLAYDGIHIIAGIFNKCNRDTLCIKEELYKVKNYPGVTGTTSFDKKGML